MMNESAPVVPYEILDTRRGITELRDLMNHVNGYDCFVAGGYARYCMSPLEDPPKPNDVDVFCREAKSYDPFIQSLVERGAETLIQTGNATTIKPPPTWKTACPTIQVISPTVSCGTPWEVISTFFDFTVTMAAIMKDSYGIVHPDFVRDETNKSLKIVNIICPVGNLKRALKYAKKGYRLSVKEMLKFYESYEAQSPEYKAKMKETANLPKDGWTEEARETYRKLVYID